MTDAAPEIGLKPLYLQVRELLTRRLIDGDWQPGDMIPSEAQIAEELGVSAGTVRKAIDTLVRENLLRRRQGRGTFVATQDDSRFVFQFFRLQPDDGPRVLPSSRVISVGPAPRAAETARRLDLPADAPVLRIRRLRQLDGVPALVERIFLDARRFEGFPGARDTPNNLYDLYARRWGVTIGRSEERLKAVAASRDEAQRLGLPPGAPLLQIERLARDLAGRPAELRISRCRTDLFHYGLKLS